jgi:hypothetical protein
MDKIGVLADKDDGDRWGKADNKIRTPALAAADITKE